MSISQLIHPTDGPIAPPAAGAELTAEARDALLARASAIIAGRIEPPPMAVPPEVAQFLATAYVGREPPPTAEALRRISDRLCLEAHYRGAPVAYFMTRAGTMAVLAAGDEEVLALLRGLSDEESPRVVVTDTESFVLARPDGF